MPAHIRTALTQVQLSVPVMEGKLMLGTWQGIYVFEHRRQAARAGGGVAFDGGVEEWRPRPELN